MKRETLRTGERIEDEKEEKEDKTRRYRLQKTSWSPQSSVPSKHKGGNMMAPDLSDS